MKQFKYNVFLNNKILHTTADSGEAKETIKELLTISSLTMGVKGGETFKDKDYPPAWREIVEKDIKQHTADMLWNSMNFSPWNANAGDGGKSITFKGLGLSWTCISARAPARPKDVIAAEKAARAAKAEERKKRNEKYRAEADQRTVNLRNRIRTQVDHAFAQGKHGTEPASKYITCQHCEAPADFIALNQAMARGAVTVDEDTIVGALCNQHSKYGVYGWQSSYSKSRVEKIPCSKLEFFYDGVRQIAVKP